MDVLWISSAFLLGILFSRIKLPPLVGYLAAGALLAAYGYESGPVLEEIAHLGVIFLLFTVGLHLRIKNIVRAEVIGAGGIHLIISTGLFMPVAMIFGYSLIPSLIIGLALGFSSTVLTAKNLERRNELGAFHGRVAIGILILQDLAAIVLLGLTSGTTPSPWSLGLLVLPLLRPAFIKLLDLSQEEELRLLFALLLALGGGALFKVVGLSSELGALVAGMMLSGHKGADDLAKKLWGLKEAFLVGFFLEIGLTGLPTINDLYFVVVLLMLLPLKAVLFFILMIAFKLRSRTSFIATISLTSYSEFMLIAGSVAVTSGFLPESIVIAMALLVAISFAINAPLANREEAIWERLDPFLTRFERDVRHPDQQIVSLGASEYLVVGMGNAGQAAYDRLKKEQQHVVGMDIDPARIQRNLTAGRRVVYGDMQDPDLWVDLDLSHIKSIMIAIGTPEAKVQATRLIRKSGFEGKIVALTMRPEEHESLRESGASAVCIPITQAGEKLAEFSLSDNLEDDSMTLNLEY
ncbi:MAG: cation:proton antiporter family protein [Balneolaceae bacterium]|nr:cation:proton antiporter family protein [Balneolaceae bacterium]